MPSLDHDRILRNQLGLIEATVRTNAYRQGAALDRLQAVARPTCPAIPQPAPLFEIYVYAPEVEGIHLRGGKIARGGLRWSDRMDYRTEVFGLMRAQMTKNAVIVPDGAKGGFYLRRRPEDPAALQAEVERGYVTYISGLLDLTDNLVDGEVVHPEGVRVLDDDDTYLVVAADKGTATFSDTANRVAGRYGFWLGDAFASGGSKGYDHKALGITARGAWESLKRHFRELDLDPAVDEFTAVGIGDMSGDVFGNGMLLSDTHPARRRLRPPPRLHRPRPRRGRRASPSASGSSSWPARRGTTTTATRSPRAAACGRAAPSASSCPSRRARRSASTTPCSRPTTSSARSCARRSTCCGTAGSARSSRPRPRPTPTPSTAPATRSASTPTELRCRVVAEGGNLGLTQRARIEFARGGGLINADFIDNSAGVDCSDHEVNLKILLDLAVRRGELDAAERDDAAGARSPTTSPRTSSTTPSCRRRSLAQEVRGSADADVRLRGPHGARSRPRACSQREVEFLPSSEEMAERRRSGRGLERPELAVLLAYAKRSLTGALLRSVAARRRRTSTATCAATSRPPSSSASATCSASTRCAASSSRRSSPTTSSTRSGRRSSRGLVAEQGAEPADVVRAYRIARDVTGAERALGGDRAPRPASTAQAQWSCMEGVDELVEATARWYLRERRPGPTWARRSRPRARASDASRRSCRQLGAQERREAREREARELVEQGVPEEIARAHAWLPGAGPRPRRHRGRGGRRPHGRGGRRDLRAARGPRADRVGRGPPRRAAAEHADSALGVAGAARRPLARAPRPRRAHAGRRARRVAGGGSRGLPRRPRPRPSPASPARAHAGGRGRRPRGADAHAAPAAARWPPSGGAL